MCDVIHSNIYTWARHKCGVLSYVYEWTLLGTWARHTCVTWFIQMCGVLHSNIYIREHVTNVTCSYIYMSQYCLWRGHVTNVWRESFKYIYVSTSQMCSVLHSNMYTWAHHKCGVLSYIYISEHCLGCGDVTSVWHDLFKCVTWSIQIRDVALLYVWRDSCIFVTMLVHTCDVTHSYVWRDFILCVMWPVQIRDVTYSDL